MELAQHLLSTCKAGRGGGRGGSGWYLIFYTEPGTENFPTLTSHTVYVPTICFLSFLPLINEKLREMRYEERKWGA